MVRLFFFCDYYSGNIGGLLYLNGCSQQLKNLFTTSAKVTAFSVDEVGEIDLADYELGALLRLERK